ncbi:hypothetical protein ACODT3_15760 [Streptomyces sp. 4.24]|uniref:hypothetical protein n=1 Tax=Streptomyces tritrimontium TaxID=3406573 RepID=UPI003BB6D603
MTNAAENDGTDTGGSRQARRERLGLGKPAAPEVCPRCGATATVPIGRALETGGCTNVIEGAVIALMAGAAGVYYAGEKDLPWLAPVGIVAALLIFAMTIKIVRDESRTADRARAAVDRARANGVRARRYCTACREASGPAEPDTA